MTAEAQTFQNSVVPLLRYRDLARAMDWLTEVFGFEKQLAVSDSDGEVVYGQMRYGTSLIMLGTVRDTDLDGYMTQPDEVGGFETQTCYVVIEDAEEHFSRSVMAGADILLELRSDPHGRRGYACRDPEGHIWNFGTFHPTVGALTRVSADVTPEAAPQRPQWPMRLAMAASLIIALFAGVVSRDFIKTTAALTVSAEEGSADYAYQLLSLVRGEARDLAVERDRLKGQLEMVAAEKAKLEIVAETATATAEKEKAQRALLETQLADAREALKAREASEQAALNQARTAEERIAALTQEQVAAKAHAEAERDEQERSAAVLQEGSRAIETSATTPTSEPSAAAEAAKASAVDQPEKAEQALEKSIVAKRPGSAQRKPSISDAAPRPRYQPTYMIELSDVPWPYTVWNHGTIKRH